MSDFAARKTVRLTTRGRKSGQPRTVTIWFVAAGPHRIRVQHVSGPAQWYRNLLADPAVSVDFGDGEIAARATPVHSPDAVQEILAQIRSKYWTARLIQWLGRKTKPVAAEISWEA
jgi:deazaflavin-dependent oxidoreductase (nitroreductase family)